MKFFNYLLIATLIMALFTLTGCSHDTDSNPVQSPITEEQVAPTVTSEEESALSFETVTKAPAPEAVVWVDKPVDKLNPRRQHQGALDTPTLRVVGPGYGDEWRVGQVGGSTVEWSYTELAGTILIQLYRNGSFVTTIASAVPVSNLTYTWTVPAGIASGSGYQIYLRSNTYTSISCLGNPFYMQPAINQWAGSLTVTVREYGTNALLSGVSLAYGSDHGGQTNDGPFNLTGQTASNGSTSFTQIYTSVTALNFSFISATKSGYHLRTGQSLNRQATASSPNATVTIYMERGQYVRSLTVTVREYGTNALISGASIAYGSDHGGQSNGVFTDGPFNLTGQTASNGSTSFTQIWTNYSTLNFTYINVSKYGYTVRSGQSLSRQATTSSPNPTVTIYMQRNQWAGSLTVTVREYGTNALLSGVSLAYGSDHGGQTNDGPFNLTGQTASNGSTSFTQIYTSVTALNFSFISATKSGYHLRTGQSLNRQATASSPNATVTIYMERGQYVRSLTVTVREYGTNALISGASIAYGSDHGGQSNGVFTDGPFNLTGQTASNGSTSFTQIWTNYSTLNFTYINVSKYGYSVRSGQSLSRQATASSPNPSITIYMQRN